MTYGPPDPNTPNPDAPQPPAPGAPAWQQPPAPQQPAAPLGAAPQQPAAPQGAMPQGFAPQTPQGFGPQAPQGQPPSSYPAQPWGAPNPYGAPVATGRAQGPALGIFSLILGVLGIVVPFLPIDMSGGRGYLALPFGLLGLGLGIAGCFGFRSGKPAAIVGLVLSALALALGVIMLGHLFRYTC